MTNGLLSRTAVLSQHAPCYPNNKSELSQQRRVSHSMRMRRAQITFSVLLLSGCVSVQKVPDNWESLAPGSGCLSITATYNDKGESAGGWTQSLSGVLAAALGVERDLDLASRTKLRDDLRSANVVDVRLTESNDLDIIVLGSEELAHWHVDKDKHRCANGVLSIRKGAIQGGDNAASIRNADLDMHRSQGYLVLHSHGVEGGFLLLVPLVGYESWWSRFPLVKVPPMN